MEKRIVSMKHGQILGLFLMALLALFLTTGCAGKSRTYKETRTVTAQPSASESTTSASSVSTESTTTVEQTETPEGSRPQGVLSGVVHAVGQIIAFPFKVIGGIIGAIF